MPGAAKVGDSIQCGDTVAIGSSTVRINGVSAGNAGGSATSGHSCGVPSHGPTGLYTSANRTSTVFINGFNAATWGDWNVTIPSQLAPPNYPDSSSPGCEVACGSTCHDSPLLPSIVTVFIGAGSGGGAYLDDNPALADDPSNPVSSVAQSSPPAGYENITRADVQIYDNNNDDPDPDISAIGPAPDNVRVKPDINQIATDQTPPPALGSPSAPPVGSPGCSTFEALPASFTWTSVAGSFTAYATSTALSPNFTVADLTIGTAVSRYEFTASVTQASGLSQKEILLNLCFLANTVLEPMLADYGSFTVTSGFRNKSGGSQHNKGQAADIQFLSFHGTGNTGTQYFQRAQDIRDTKNYDQMILEWFGRNPWIHISVNPAGHRGNVLTQVARTSYQPGLIQLG